MKIKAEDLDKVIRLTGAEDSSGLRMALAFLLISIWDRGYTEGQNDAMDRKSFNTGECPYTTMAHTKEWCGYASCRES